MRPLVLLWGCLVLPGYEALTGPKEISGFEGDTVSLRCTYKKEMKVHRKYWCRQGGILLSRCGDTVYTNQDQEVTRGKMSIRDSLQDLWVTVTMRDLTLKDSGKYWCGIDRLGRDESFEVKLIVFPGKRDSPVPTGTCCPSSPTPSFQPLTPTRRLQPKAKAWLTQLPELTSPGLHPTVVTTKQGKTRVKAPVFTEAAPAWSTGTSQVPSGISPHAGSSPHTATPARSAGTSQVPPGISPYAGRSPHTATSPHAGSSRPVIWPPLTTPKDSRAVTSSVSKSSVSIPMVRIMAPVLVLLSLLLAAGLIAIGSHMLRRQRKKSWLATETQKNEKVYLETSLPGNGWTSEDSMIDLAVPPECLRNPNPSAEKHNLSQSAEEEAAPSLDAEEDVVVAPPLHMSAEELAFSEFISV
ncbi:CMRF35-like molecule 9 isoform X1 [Rattus norvegicus]|uniref:Cd300 molecule-like family member G n=1 Tax=Rattus norvegicus TaxID=10116 RepID=M0R459_RAT|nr:CMRF35-like molecule 9 isoform X1 [Rattus norvegicus]|eukprot:XP_003750984.1 PREDICTED: CMRF35-like molecule 9 isoform X1 [Rattus norvegicus]